MSPQRLVQIAVGDEVAVDQDEGLLTPHEALGLLEAPGRPQDHRLLRVIDLEAEAATVADRSTDRLRLMVQVDHHLLHLEALQVLERVHDDRAVEQGKGRLGSRLGERVHPLSETGRKNHRLHDAISA